MYHFCVKLFAHWHIFFFKVQSLNVTRKYRKFNLKIDLNAIIRFRNVLDKNYNTQGP